MNQPAVSAEELRDLYRELILDHARKPRHFGKLPSATHSAQGINPLCGDKLHLYLEVTNGLVSTAAFEGSGCAISMASASLLTDAVKGKTTEDALALSRSVVGRLSNATDVTDKDDIGKLQALEGVKEFPARVKCATLAWHALESALKRDTNPASTE